MLFSDYLALPEEERQNIRKENHQLKKTTYFKSVGMGLFDICIAKKLLEKAKEK